MPEVDHGERARANGFINDVPDGRARTVIGNDDFKVSERLPLTPREHETKLLGFVINCNDQ
jgi:hypothetical protein